MPRLFARTPPNPLTTARRLVRNGAAGGAGHRTTPCHDALALHRQLPGYAPTELHSLPALAAELGVGAVHVKDETRRFGLGSFKIVGASWAAFCAVCERLGLDPATASLEHVAALLAERRGVELVTASAGNHGEAVARIAALLGIPAQVLLPQVTSAERVQAIEAAGGTVTIVDGTYDEAVAQALTWADDQRLLIADVARTPDERAPRDVVDGYATILRECDDQLAGAGTVGAILVPAGVGSFAAAVVRHVTAPAPPAWARGARVVVVEPESASCIAASLEAGRLTVVPADRPTSMAGMNCGRPSAAVWDDLRAGVDAAVSILDEDAERGMQALAEHGVAAGPCGGAGMGAALALADGLIDSAGLGALGLTRESGLLLFATEGVRTLAAEGAIQQEEVTA